MPHQLQTPIVLTPGGSNFLYVQTDTLAVEERRNHLFLRKLNLDTKGKGLERPPIIFDGLLPRIETRGQSRVSSTKSGKKKDDISRPQDCVHQDESVSLSDAAKRSEPTAVDDTAAFPASRQENQD
ncbi:predicted protein [Verticillium alfalfae VaMs.102]|uniref:Predicted protein n=1 Tax=Verticillium alfalfae (strain VaMs.102 / ATCC MYA-4576 / FGSC 10136) TaxID=526221 RepID=C9SX96_VERA1|nr:predicted protein [Verticillium alfalfae VaMs.102]EEY23286.1 predicted protein [Verticillium alfalfae VaMs.102]